MAETERKTETKVKRLLYLSEHEARYVAGNPEKYSLQKINKNLPVVTDLVKESEDKFIELLLEADKDVLLPRRVTLFFALAYALSKTECHKNNETRMKLARTALSICRTDEEIFKFISLFTELNKCNSKNKITTSLSRLFNKYLNNKTPLEMAESVAKMRGYHGWTYKDLIKLSHFKSESVEKTCLAEYVLYDLKSIQSKNEASSVIPILEKWETLRKTECEQDAARLVKELKADFQHTNSKFCKSQIVWAAILEEMPVRNILRLLPKFFRWGMLKADSPVNNAVVAAMTSSERIKACKLHPIEVFISMKDFEKGGKPLDPKLEAYLKAQKEASGEANEKSRPDPKCSPITNTFGKCLSLCYTNNSETFRLGKKLVLTLDVLQQSENVCFKNRNISCLDAQLALSLFYCKTEKNISMTIFNNKNVRGLNLDRNAPFAQNMQKLVEHQPKYLLFPSVFQWAITKKKEVDLFICFLQSPKSLKTAPKELLSPAWNSLKDGLQKYQTTMSQPKAKLVVICLGSHDLQTYSDSDSLTICGFCPEIPNLIKAFVQGSFS